MPKADERTVVRSGGCRREEGWCRSDAQGDKLEEVLTWSRGPVGAKCVRICFCFFCAGVYGPSSSDAVRKRDSKDSGAARSTQVGWAAVCPGSSPLLRRESTLRKCDGTKEMHNAAQRGRGKRRRERRRAVMSGREREQQTLSPHYLARVERGLGTFSLFGLSRLLPPRVTAVRADGGLLAMRVP